MAYSQFSPRIINCEWVKFRINNLKRKLSRYTIANSQESNLKQFFRKNLPAINKAIYKSKKCYRVTSLGAKCTIRFACRYNSECSLLQSNALTHCRAYKILLVGTDRTICAVSKTRYTSRCVNLLTIGRNYRGLGIAPSAISLAAPRYCVSTADYRLAAL